MEKGTGKIKALAIHVIGWLCVWGKEQAHTGGEQDLFGAATTIH